VKRSDSGFSKSGFLLPLLVLGLVALAVLFTDLAMPHHGRTKGVSEEVGRALPTHDGTEQYRCGVRRISASPTNAPAGNRAGVLSKPKPPFPNTGQRVPVPYTSATPKLEEGEWVKVGGNKGVQVG
jgi:hypothetical protein